MRGFTLAVGLLIVSTMGCGDDDPDVGSGNGQCALRSGSYVSTFVTRSGNCGDLPETIGNITTQPKTAEDVGEGCTGSIAYSADNCQVTIDTTCPTPGTTGTKARNTGIAKWSRDGSLGQSTQTITITDAGGNIVCVGTYDLTQRRQ